MNNIERTNRGFRVYGRVSERGGGALRVQESSLAGEGAHAWIFLDGVKCGDHLGQHIKPDPQLSVAQAKLLVEALQSFIADAEADRLTEPAQV